ncbi:ArpU family phage packaging/lysis transcriptional regulator [uncultured Lactobacillus sp.]|uniref:ArpU family phage packaging/lysis transcriptional regulator n=1 Tax=uncultured Lactobacillus sp. TaxID=153152 RepID=UPI00280463AF|nr:ArpU family phage packaging/lysis transcriptional regulator [uncultured Lactobacillus sp.]
MFLPEIDKKETLRKTRRFFDKELDKYINLSGKHRFDLKSPIIDGLPKGSNINNNDSFMMNIFYAEQIIKCVSDAINLLTDTPKKPYKTIIIDKYINCLTSQQIALKIQYSNSRTATKMNEALLEFAQRFQCSQKISKLEPSIKLVVYKEPLINKFGRIVKPIYD